MKKIRQVWIVTEEEKPQTATRTFGERYVLYETKIEARKAILQISLDEWLTDATENVWANRQPKTSYVEDPVAFCEEVVEILRERAKNGEAAISLFKKRLTGKP